MSVWPMVSESMTKPRDRNRLITRLNVNGLLSIVATSVCFKGNYLRQCRPRDDHGKNVFVRIDQELDERRPGGIHRPFDGFGHLGRIFDRPGRDAVRVGELDEVGWAGQVNLDVVL